MMKRLKLVETFAPSDEMAEKELEIKLDITKKSRKINRPALTMKILMSVMVLKLTFYNYCVLIGGVRWFYCWFKTFLILV